jgi:hypothetical protein
MKASAWADQHECERLLGLEREVRELRRANEILKAPRLLRGGARPPTTQMIAYVDAHKDRFGSSRSRSSGA